MSESRVASAAEAATAWRTEIERRWNAVQTWRATAVIEVRAGDAATPQHRRCEFVIDRPRRCLRWNLTSKDEGAHSAGIVKNGSVWLIGQHAGSRNAVITVTGLFDPDATRAFSDHDPIVWLTAGMMTTRSAFERPGGPLDLTGWQIDQESNEHLPLRQPRVEAAITGDPQSGQIAAVRNSGTESSDEMTSRWERHGEIWVPVEITHRLSTPIGTTSQTRIEFQSSIVNEPVDPGEWSLSAIGAKGGDLVQDRTREVQFVYQGRTVADAQNSDPPLSRARTVTLNVSVWIVILILLLLLRRRRCVAGPPVVAGAGGSNDASHPED